MSESLQSGGGVGPTGVGEQGSRGDGKSPLLDTPNLRNLRNLRIIFSSACIALAAVWLYRRALSFAFFNDDPTGHFAWMEGQSLLGFFSGSAEYGYYRPIVFVVLRLSEILFGNETFPHNPAADHALLLLLHGVNAALVWALARRLGRSDGFAWVAALVFAFTPFSYEAVAYVASLTHPLSVFWMLLALLLYDRAVGRAGEQGMWGPDGSPRAGEQQTRATEYLLLLGSLLAMCLDLLTHENGLFIFPALVGLDWVRRPGASWRERARRLWPFAVPPVLFAALWLIIPKNSEQGLNGLADAGRNLVPFLQTLVYPLLPVARFDAADALPLVLLSVAVVAVLALLAWRAGALRLWAYGLGWLLLSALPAVLFLGPAYVYGSPRLSYLPSIGAAILWGMPVLWLWRKDRRRPADDGRQTTDHSERGSFAAVGSRRSAVYIALTGAYTLALILPPLPFITCQLDFYDETSRIARGMAAAAASAPVEREVVFVNAPFFFSSTATRPDGCPSPYPWTPVGGVLIPPYAQARDFVRFNGGPDRAVSGVTYAGYAPGWRTFGLEIDGTALRAHATRDAVFVFDLLSGVFSNLTAAWQPGAASAGATTPLVSFGDVLALTGARLNEDGDTLTVGLNWRVENLADAPLAAFVHVYNAGGALAAQSDGPPGDGLAPQALWQPGDGLADERRLDLSALPPGRYTVAAGIYNAIDGARLTAKANGELLTDDAFLLGVIQR